MRNQFVIPAVVIGLFGFLGMAYLGHSIYQSRKNTNYVTVKGLAEIEVTADKGSWLIQTELSDPLEASVKREADRQLANIKQFLYSKGFETSEVNVVEYNIRQNLYGNGPQRYISSIQVSVFTDKVDLLDEVSRNVNELIEAGIRLSGDRWSTRPRFFFTDINSVKPELLAESTRAARRSAEEFAKNSEAEVGGIKYARQGILSLIPASRIGESEEFHKEKIVRVVSTIDYYLK